MFTATEYYTPVWCQSTHTKTLDVSLNEAMRLVCGCIHPPCKFFLPPLLGIQPPSCHRKNSVNAYTTNQITLTIFYTTSCTAKPLPKGLNLANLFTYFWNQSLTSHASPSEIRDESVDHRSKPMTSHTHQRCATLVLVKYDSNQLFL